MIKVDRNQVQSPARLTEPNSDGVSETIEALKFYSVEANHKEKFPFKAYRHAEVKDLLVELFHGKCAYCEGTVSGGHDGDVEHFRPKGAVEVNGHVVKPGYYWLAASWENLFLSCMHCNQKRKHRDGGTVVLTAGKANKFPVADENGRVTFKDLPADLLDAQGNLDQQRLSSVCSNEERLLIDPCVDEPNDYLLFLDDGMILATKDEDDIPDPKGDASILTFGLHRPQLLNDRANELLKIEDQKDIVEMALKELDQNPDNQFASRALERALKSLETFCTPEQRFSGMARQVVDRFLKELGL